MADLLHSFLLRLAQELVLGIGGWRLLGELGLRPEVCHLNEGHATFAVLERARSFMQDTGQPCNVALTATRASNLFTTHTPVAAGFDRFAPALVEQYLGQYAQNMLQISLQDLLALGREHPDDPAEPFNMAYLALRGSGAVNGVSRLPGQGSRRILQSFFPRWPEIEMPIGQSQTGCTCRRGTQPKPTNSGLLPAHENAGGERWRLWPRICAVYRTLGSGNSVRPPARHSSATLVSVLCSNWLLLGLRQPNRPRPSRSSIPTL